MGKVHYRRLTKPSVRGSWLVTWLLLSAVATPALAQRSNADLMCAPEQPSLTPHRYLRAMSLDLRGVLPSAEEYARLDSGDTTTDELLEDFLQDPRFVARAIRFHRSLLWNNISNIRILQARFRLSTQRADGDLIYWRGNQAARYRGSRVLCENAPARFGADGEILTRRVGDADVEGWVLVEPYWAPGTMVRVCAFDAQELRISSAGNDCLSNTSNNDLDCGCGPALRWCSTNQSEELVLRSMAEAMERRIALVLSEGRPYTELFTGRDAFVNGPIVHFWRNWTVSTAGLQLEPHPLPVDRLPELSFAAAEEWRPIRLPAEHAGLLTDPVFLLRFQTNRSRANRFYTSFLCKPFQAPEGGLPSPDDECSAEPDLQNRCGCKYCHALLEPTGAYWGRWTQQGIGFLGDEVFPSFRDDCYECARTGRQCSDMCRRFYVTRALVEEEEPFLGSLQAFMFRRSEHERNIAHGPRLLALSMVADNQLPTCVATKAVEWLTGRPALDEEKAWVQDLSTAFVASDYSYRALIRRIVTHPMYRSVR